ncbi:hypothetical protein VTH82DRAFT_2181 [Thermothelomyces myriococcoides]
MGSVPDRHEDVLLMPSLGQDVQLGMLYDARSSQLYAGLSLWDSKDVNTIEEIDENKVQDTKYEYSFSIDEAREKSSLDVEGSLSLDLKILSVTGSAKYLNDKKSSTHEARLYVTCTVARRTRRIPQEVLSNMKYDRYLDDPRFTHFVAEVVEGGTATLSFVRSCSSAEEAERVTGELKVSIVKIPVSGSAKIDFSKEKESLLEKCNISYSGALAENVTTLEDARRVAREMPTKLASQLNTLSYKLLPLSVLDSKARRFIRTLDANLVAETAKTLNNGNAVALGLNETENHKVFGANFPTIRNQIQNFQSAFSTAQTEFIKTARRLIPELRDGSSNEAEKSNGLRNAVKRFESCVRVARKFVDIKNNEARALETTVNQLLKKGFESWFGESKFDSLFDKSVWLLLSFGDPKFTRQKHPLQAELKKINMASEEARQDDNSDDEDDDDSSDDEEEEEWFEDDQVIEDLKRSCVVLDREFSRKSKDSVIKFGLANIRKAYRPGGRKQSKTSMGDIILANEGKYIIATDILSKRSPAPELRVRGQTIEVLWSPEKDEKLKEPSILKGVKVRYRRRLNPSKDGAFPRACENEIPNYVSCANTSETGVTLRELSDDCDYEVSLGVESIIGPLEWSEPAVGRTEKLPSVASEMVDFFRRFEDTLSKADSEKKKKKDPDPENPDERKPWSLARGVDGGRDTLYLGLKEVERRYCEDKRFENRIAVRIVDVAGEFKPELPAANIDDSDNTIVAVFVGTSGHGKSTEINAFISFLLGDDVDDAARIMVIDDRGAKQSDSVTRMVTCYRVRPLSSQFRGKTLLIVDTPGYGDTQGIRGDEFVTAAMSVLFGTIRHVNNIFFVCNASVTRTTLLKPVATYVFSLFHKEVQSCLRTIYTFCNDRSPKSREALKDLGWPVRNGEVFVNNSGFSDGGGGNLRDFLVREAWKRSMGGQNDVMQMLLLAPAVPTQGSADVVKQRLFLESQCQLTERNIFYTAGEAKGILLELESLANAVGAAPGEKVPLRTRRAVTKDVPKGAATTLCFECKMTCHEICTMVEDSDKTRCAMMTREGTCIACPGRCGWDKHRNYNHIITMEDYTEWVVPDELVKRWNDNNNSLESALITAIDKYLELQKQLRDDLRDLDKLSHELTQRALAHNPANLINYVDTLIKTARARNAPPEQLVQLSTARNTLIILDKVKDEEEGATQESSILLDVLRGVRDEMGRRMKLSAKDRAAEEQKPCTLYDDLCQKLPLELRNKAPPLFGPQSALYPANLKAVVRLVRVVLEDGSIVAALAAAST